MDPITNLPICSAWLHGTPQCSKQPTHSALRVKYMATHVQGFVAPLLKPLPYTFLHVIRFRARQKRPNHNTRPVVMRSSTTQPSCQPRRLPMRCLPSQPQQPWLASTHPPPTRCNATHATARSCPLHRRMSSGPKPTQPSSVGGSAHAHPIPIPSRQARHDVGLGVPTGWRR